MQILSFLVSQHPNVPVSLYPCIPVFLVCCFVFFKNYLKQKKQQTKKQQTRNIGIQGYRDTGTLGCWDTETPKKKSSKKA